MCDCINLVNEKLKDRNLKLSSTFSFSGLERVALVTTTLDPQRKKGPALMLPTYCPFCGERYEKIGAHD